MQQTGVDLQIQHYPLVAQTLVNADQLPNGTIQTYQSFQALKANNTELVNALSSEIEPYFSKKIDTNYAIVPMTVVHQGSNDNSPMKIETVQVIVATNSGATYVLMPNSIRTQAMSINNAEMYYDAKGNICFFPDPAHSVMMKIPANLQNDFLKLLPPTKTVQPYTTLSQKMQQHHLQNNVQPNLSNNNNNHNKNPNPIYNQQYRKLQSFPQLSSQNPRNYQNQPMPAISSFPMQNIGYGQNGNLHNNNQNINNNFNNIPNQTNPNMINNNVVPNPVNLNFVNQQQLMQQQNAQAIQALQRQINTEVPACILTPEKHGNQDGWRASWDNKWYPSVTMAQNPDKNSQCHCNIMLTNDNKPLTTDTIPPKILYKIRNTIDGTNWSDTDINGKDRLHTLEFNEQQHRWTYSNEVYNKLGQKLLPDVAVNTVEATQADILQQPIQMFAPNKQSIEMQDEASMSYVAFLRECGKMQRSNVNNNEEFKEQSKTLYLNLNRKLRELTVKLEQTLSAHSNDVGMVSATQPGSQIIPQIREIRNILWRQYYCRTPTQGTLPGELPPTDPRYRNITKKNQFLHDHILSNGVNGYIPGYFEEDGTYIEGKFRYYIPMIKKCIEFTESDMNDFIEKQQVLVGNENLGSTCFFNAANVFLQSDYLKTMCLLKIGEKIFEKDGPINQASTDTTTHCTLKPEYKYLLSTKYQGSQRLYFTLALADYIYAVHKGHHTYVSPYFLLNNFAVLNPEYVRGESGTTLDYYRDIIAQNLYYENAALIPNLEERDTTDKRLLCNALSPEQQQQYVSSFGAGSFTTSRTANCNNSTQPGCTTYSASINSSPSIQAPPKYISNNKLNKNTTTLLHKIRQVPETTEVYFNTYTQKTEENTFVNYESYFADTTDRQVIHIERGKNNVNPHVCSMPLYVENEGNYFELQNIVLWDPCGGIGHFMNYRKHPNGRWYKYSDTSIHEVTEEEVLKCLTKDKGNYMHSYGRVAPGRWKEKMEEQQQALLNENARQHIKLSSQEADKLRKILIQNFGKDLTGLKINIGEETYKVSNIVDTDWQMIFQKLHNIHRMTGTISGRLENNRRRLETSPLIDFTQLTFSNQPKEPALLFSPTFTMKNPNFGNSALTRQPFWAEYTQAPNANQITLTPHSMGLSNYEKCINAMREAIRTNNPEIKVELYPIQDQQEPAQLQQDTKPQIFTIGQVLYGYSDYASLAQDQKQQAMDCIRLCYHSCKQQEKFNRTPTAQLSAHADYFSKKLCDLGVAQSNGNGTIKIEAINITPEIQVDINKAKQKKPQVQPVILPNQKKNTQKLQVIVPKKEINSPPYPPVENDKQKAKDVDKISKIVTNTEKPEQQSKNIDNEDENSSDEQDSEHDNNEQNYKNGPGNNQALPSASTSNSEHNPTNSQKNTSKQQPYGTKPTTYTSNNPQQSNNSIYNKPTSNQNNTNVVNNNSSLKQQLSFNYPNSSLLKTNTKNTANNFTNTLTSVSTLQQHLPSYSLSTTQFTTPTKTSSTNNNSTSLNKNNNTTTQSTKTNTNANVTNTPLEEPSYVGDIIIGAGLGGATTGLGTLGMTKVIPIKQVLAVAIMILGLAVMIGALIHGFYKKNKYEEEKRTRNNTLHNLTTTNQQTNTPTASQ